MALTWALGQIQSLHGHFYYQGDEYHRLPDSQLTFVNLYHAQPILWCTPSGMQQMQMWSHYGNEPSLLLTHTRCLWGSSRLSFGTYVRSDSFRDGANSFSAAIFTLFTDWSFENLLNKCGKQTKCLKNLVNDKWEENHFSSA